MDRILPIRCDLEWILDRTNATARGSLGFGQEHHSRYDPVRGSFITALIGMHSGHKIRCFENEARRFGSDPQTLMQVF